MMQTYAVEGAGRPEVNGIYARSGQQCEGADVFRKAGTTFAILRHGSSHWSIVDLRGSALARWSLRTVELYRAVQIPAGNIPPSLGWTPVDGESPAPMVHMAKSAVFSEFALRAMTGRLPSKTNLGRVGQAVLAKAASEPRLPKPRTRALAIPGRAADAPGGVSDLAVQPGHGDTAGWGQHPAPGNGIRKFLCSFRVALTRPSPRVPWGIEWSEDAYRQTGARTVASMRVGSPVERWNVWQQVRGRQGFGVEEGDQLVRVDGRWAFHEVELGSGDADCARQAISSGTSAEDGRCIVLEFLRPVVRAATPLAPRLEVWDAQQHLVINWEKSSAALAQFVLGWAICVQDVDGGNWYVVDGGTRTANAVGMGGVDVGALAPEMTSAHVWEGLPAGRDYAVCIAALTQRGWSAFSELSRPGHLGKSAAFIPGLLAKTGPVEEDWPDRPRFAAPSEMLPGASAPVALRHGARDFLGVRRRIQLRAVMRGCTNGLHREVQLRPIGAVLLVEHVLENSFVAKWNQAQLQSFSPLVHGAVVVPALRPGDLIVKVNGLWGGQAMLDELMRCPTILAMTLERRSGGFANAEEPQDESDGLFVFDSKIDAELVKAAEDVHWHALLSPEEGVLAAKMVESDVDQLEAALHNMQVTAGAGLVQPRYKDILQEAERRCYTMRRSVLAFADETSTPRDALSSTSFSGSAQDQKAIVSLRAAMADISEDHDHLQQAILHFTRASAAVTGSEVGLRLLQRARDLQALWSWRVDCERARSELSGALDAILRREWEFNSQTRVDLSSEEPPYDVKSLRQVIDAAQPYADELALEIAEAEEVVVRLTRANAKYVVHRQVYAVAAHPAEDEEELLRALQAAQAMGVDPRVIRAGCVRLNEWREQHSKNTWQDDLVSAIEELRGHVRNREKPGAGAEAQQRVREAIANVSLERDHPLVQEAMTLLKHWEGDNLALRAEARLQSAVRRAAKGFSFYEAEAGDLLSSAIAEAAQQGVEVAQIERARETLASWQSSRARKVVTPNSPGATQGLGDTSESGLNHRASTKTRFQGEEGLVFVVPTPKSQEGLRRTLRLPGGEAVLPPIAD